MRAGRSEVAPIVFLTSWESLDMKRDRLWGDLANDTHSGVNEWQTQVSSGFTTTAGQAESYAAFGFLGEVAPNFIPIAGMEKALGSVLARAEAWAVEKLPALGTDLGRVASSWFARNAPEVTPQISEVIGAQSGMFSTGVIPNGNGLPKTIETVIAHAESGGIGLEGIKLRIIPEAPPQFYGWAHPSGREIHLYPSAFANPESLVKTLGHERTHAMQFQLYGPAPSTAVGGEWERAAMGIENSFWEYHLFKTGNK